MTERPREDSPAPWLHIIGLGEDGLDGLSAAALEALSTARTIVGGKRHHALTQRYDGKRLTWPQPFDHLIETLKSLRGTPTVVLVTGDPLWFSAGTKIAAEFAQEDVHIHPHVSAFQLACARMCWSLSDVQTLTVHGRAVDDIHAFLAPGAKLVLLTHDGETPNEVAKLLTASGYAQSQMMVLGAMGGPDETRLAGTAASFKSWASAVPAFHTLCVQCVADRQTKPIPRGPGLPDSAFDHDGKMTKRDIRALTLAKLAPRPGHILWDIGTGCGSVAIEWMRSADRALAIGIEPNAARRTLALSNAKKLGTTKLVLVDAKVPDILKPGAVLPGTQERLSAPDAVFIGGGLSGETVDACLQALKPFGRLVANAVTLESEQVLIDLHSKHGGDLTRISVAHADPVGRYRGWRPAMPVTQWSLTL